MAERQLDSVFEYCQSVVASFGNTLKSGDVFAKVLTNNDDSGRHGVLVPSEVYGFFPDLVIADSKVNATTPFTCFDFRTMELRKLAYKYYQRYPERRITCLSADFSDRQSGVRIAVYIRAEHQDGSSGYYADLLRERVDVDFSTASTILFGSYERLLEGMFVMQAVDSPAFVIDDALADFLYRFDVVSEMGWVDSLRAGDTGIGYTFETLIGIEENNDRSADFRGIEIKCKQVKEIGGRAGKINLFQQAPCWDVRMSSLDRLRMIGQVGDNGRHSCYSQVTTTQNNLKLWLNLVSSADQIDLIKDADRFGFWAHSALSERLREKHSRAVFVKADVRKSKGRQRFKYQELVYCESPSIQRFAELVQNRRLVFEFTMSENEKGRVRNHGYPWRLIGEEYLADLYSIRVQLR